MPTPAGSEYNARRIHTHDEPAAQLIDRLSSIETPPRNAHKADGPFDVAGRNFLTAMHAAGNRILGKSEADFALYEADRLLIHGPRLAQFGKIANNDPVTGLALLRAASLVITLPPEVAAQYPGHTTSIGKSQLKDSFTGEHKPFAVEPLVDALIKKHPGLGYYRQPKIHMSPAT